MREATSASVSVLASVIASAAVGVPRKALQFGIVELLASFVLSLLRHVEIVGRSNLVALG
jgi:hypothetical protein